MANIQGYEAPQGLGLQPSETGIDAILQGARRVGAFADQAGNAITQTGQRLAGAGKDAMQVGLDYENHREISAGAANGAQFVANFNNLWNDTIKNADPNDPTVKQKFLEQNLEPALQKFQSGFNTDKSQEWAEHFADQYRQHMFEKTSADMSTMAGIAVRTNAEKTINSLASAVASDPSSLDFALKSVDHSIGGTVDSSPALDATTAASIKGEIGLHAKEQIVKAAVSGMITKNPNVDLDAIEKKYGDYLKPGEMLMFQKAAQSQAKVNNYYDKQTALAEKQAADLQVHTTATKTISDNVQIDPQTNQTTIKPQFFKDALDIARNNPNAPSAAATARTMIDWGESQLNKERKVTTDPTVASSIDSRMFTSDNPISKMDILQAEAAGKLTRSDAEIRTKIIDQRDKMPSDPQFKLAMDGAKELIEGRTAGEKSLQSGKYASFMQQFLEDYQRQKAAGTLPANALSLRDPKSLLSQTMEAYKSPLAAAIGGNGGVTAAPPPSIPAPATTPNYKEGDVVQTSEGPRRFKGGSYRDKKNWEPVS